MTPFFPDQHIHLTVAEGFIGLDMYQGADAALDDIDPFCRHLPEVLAVRVRVHWNGGADAGGSEEGVIERLYMSAGA